MRQDVERARWIQIFYPVTTRDAYAMVAAGLTNEQVSAAVVAYTQAQGLVDLHSIIKLLLMDVPMPMPDDWQQLGQVISYAPVSTTRQHREYAEQLLADFVISGRQNR